jgi:Flp pilus assembly protein CpaB
MKPKTMILMGLAIVCGLGASYMTSRLLAERQVTDEEKVKILVAKRVLSVGERLTKPEDCFEVKEVSRDSEPPDAIKDLDALKNKIMKQSRNRGDHVTPANLWEGGGLDIPEGHQAVGLPVNLTTTAHGLASLPGSRVDLILTLKGQNPLETRSITVLQNVLVLAADGRTNREGEIVAPATVVTFALKPKEKLMMVTASEMGPIRLSLRKLHDDSPNSEVQITATDILNKAKNEQPNAMVQANPTKPEPKISFEPTPEPKDEPRFTNHSFQIISPSGVQSINYRRFENGDVEFEDGHSTVPNSRRQSPRSTPPQPKQDKSNGDV